MTNLTRILASVMFVALVALATLVALISLAPERLDIKPDELEFALIGDNPYTDDAMPKYERMIEQINDQDMAFVMHLGDMMNSGDEGCTNAVLHRFHELNQRFAAPFVLTPGDNDWFDCARKSAGGWDRRDRLAKLREIFFPVPGDADGITVTAQEGYPENVYWHQQDVTIGAMHLVGIVGGEGGLDIHGELMQTAIAWLDEIFTAAVRAASKGVFIATQADPWPFSVEPSLLPLLCPDCPRVRPGYEDLDAALLKHSGRFPGPVVLAVGDTHIFRVDKPLYDGENLMDNFTRVQAFGHPNVHWVRVRINPDASGIFEFHQELVPGNTTGGWQPLDDNADENPDTPLDTSPDKNS